ncbi:unnamed protein product [Peniophora sp. CBMAI 1063]|nr:unnamed protein product [Peniophora sp. CBMAI 1063]
MQRVESILSNKYQYEDWAATFGIANKPDNGTSEALKALEIKRCGFTTAAAVSLSTPVPVMPTRLALSRERDAVESQLLDALGALHSRNRLHGEPLTIDEYLENPEEAEVSPSNSPFPQPEDEAGIIVAAKQAVAASLAGQPFVPGVDDVNGDKDEDNDPMQDHPGLTELQAMCEMLKRVSILHADASGVDVLGLQAQLRKLRGHFRRVQSASARQTTLTMYFT